MCRKAKDSRLFLFACQSGASLCLNETPPVHDQHLLPVPVDACDPHIRAADHPEDSLSVYQPAIEPLVNQTNNEAYRQAIDLILKVKDVMTRLDQETDAVW